MPENNIQTSNIGQYKTVSDKKANEFQQEVKTQKQKQETKIDTKKLAVSAAAAIGITAAVLGGIHLARKGKAKQALKGLHSAASEVSKPSDTIVSDSAKQVINTVKTFFDSAGKQVDGVKLLKGKAVSSDGSMFSGAMETLTKSGKKVKIEYLDGFMTESKVNGKLFKTYEQFKGLARSNAQKISQFNEQGAIVSTSVHSYFDNGRLRRLFKVALPDETVKIAEKNILSGRAPYTSEYLLEGNFGAKAIDFSPSGKKISESVYRNSKEIKSATLWNEKGEIIRKIEGPFDDVYEGGKLAKRRTIDRKYVGKYTDRCTLSDADISFHTPEISFYDKDGKTVIKNYKYYNPANFEFEKGQSIFSVINGGKGGRELFVSLGGDALDFSAHIGNNGTITPVQTTSKENIRKITELMQEMLETGKQERPTDILDRLKIENTSGLPNIIQNLQEYAKTL